MQFLEQLPVEKRTSTTFGSTAKALLSALVIFLLINLLLLLYVGRYPPEFGPWLVEAKWRLLINMDEPKDVLILGDSTANQALIPEQIQEATGLSTVNLGTVASLTAMNDVWMLQEYLEHHPAPKLVIVVHSYQAWLRPIVPSGVGNVPVFSINASSVLTPHAPMSMQDFFEQRLLHFIPAYSQSGSFRRLIRTILQVPPDLSLLGGRQYGISELGAYSVQARDSADLHEDLEEHLRFVELPLREVTHENVAAATKLVELAREYDLNVVVLNAPLIDEVANSTAFRSYFASIEAFLLEKFSDKNVTYVPAIYSFPEEQMESVDHLLADGATIFTQQIIETIILPAGNN